MSLVVSVVIAFLYLDRPWRWVVMVAALFWEGLEIWIFLKWRKVKARTGHDALVGMTGRTVTDCRPQGQARIREQLWRVTCEPGVDAGGYVRVTGARGIELKVEPYEPTGHSFEGGPRTGG